MDTEQISISDVIEFWQLWYYLSIMFVGDDDLITIEDDHPFVTKCIKYVTDNNLLD